MLFKKVSLAFRIMSNYLTFQRFFQKSGCWAQKGERERKREKEPETETAPRGNRESKSVMVIEI